MEYTGRSNQTMIDVAIQLGGSVEAAYMMCVANGVDITDDATGKAITYDEAMVVDDGVVSALSIDGVVPAGQVLDEQIMKGIGYWRVERNLMVQ